MFAGRYELVDGRTNEAVAHYRRIEHLL